MSRMTLIAYSRIWLCRIVLRLFDTTFREHVSMGPGQRGTADRNRETHDRKSYWSHTRAHTHPLPSLCVV